jgi:MFS family permease
MIARVGREIKEYSSHLVAFQPNARLYLTYGIIAGVALGIFRLLFNFYVLALGFDEKLLGNLVATTNLTALIVALPMGYLADYLGRKASLVIAGSTVFIAIAMMAIWPAPPILYAMNILSGVGQSLAAVTMSPFLMENSGEHERTYLFSFSSGIQMVSASIGSWIGGYLPSWVAGFRNVTESSSQAYAGSVLVVAITLAISVLPLMFIRMPRLAHGERSVFAPLAYASKYPRQLAQLVLPILITFIGAGLIMPFMNVFFRLQYQQSDQVIGMIFAWGSLAMGVGLLVAPPLAERFGRIQIVVITQALSIPFLVLLGFSPVFWASGLAYYIRVALMNMSGPIYQIFVMEKVESSSRAMVASLVNMATNFGYAFSPTISGILQVRYGFGPPFLGTIFLYALSVFLYWFFWWRKGGARAHAETEIALK